VLLGERRRLGRRARRRRSRARRRNLRARRRSRKCRKVLASPADLPHHRCIRSQSRNYRSVVIPRNVSQSSVSLDGDTIRRLFCISIALRKIYVWNGTRSISVECWSILCTRCKGFVDDRIRQSLLIKERRNSRQPVTASQIGTLSIRISKWKQGTQQDEWFRRHRYARRWRRI
jgi:hypothetical protein